jgi:acetyl-CoA carboxylase carboxyl transferase subunit alpha
MASSPKSQECNWLFFIVLSAIRGGDSRCTDRFRNLKWESVESLVIAMKNYLDFEKPIAELQRKMDELQRHREAHGIEISLDKEIRQIKKKISEERRRIFSDLTPWQRVQLARHPKRPYTLDYIRTVFSDFAELHGDRLYGNDQAMVGGFAKIGDQKVVVLGTQKGRDTKENIRRNFGSAHPEGYRKALRLMRLADKFSLPIITLIDTAGAYPGIAAEERHIAEAIAVNLREMILMELWEWGWPTVC